MAELEPKFKVGDRVVETIYDRKHGVIDEVFSVTKDGYCSFWVIFDGKSKRDYRGEAVLDLEAESSLKAPEPQKDPGVQYANWHPINAEHFVGAHELTTYAQALPKVQE